MSTPIVVPRPTVGTGAVVGYLVRCARSYAVVGVTESLLAPLVYLLALGVGLGTLVDADGPQADFGGVRYVAFIGPALLVAAAVQTAAGEAMYPVYGRLKWRRVFEGVIATPVRPAQLADAELLFIALRTFVGAVCYYLVLLLFAAAGGPGGVAMIGVGVLTALAVAAWVLVVTSTSRSEHGPFNWLLRFVIVPMTLFSGSFFPIDRIPALLRPLAWISPLWHGNELARGAAFGGLGLLAALGHLVYLLVLAVSGWWVARRTFTRRLIT